MSGPDAVWHLMDRKGNVRTDPDAHVKPCNSVIHSFTEYRRADLPPTREQIMADPRVMALVQAARDALIWDNCPDLWAGDIEEALAALTDNEGETE